MNWWMTLLRRVPYIAQMARWRDHASAGRMMSRAAERRIRRGIERRLHGRSSEGTA